MHVLWHFHISGGRVFEKAVDILPAPVTEIFLIFYRHKNLDYFREKTKKKILVEPGIEPMYTSDVNTSPTDCATRTCYPNLSNSAYLKASLCCAIVYTMVYL